MGNETTETEQDYARIPGRHGDAPAALAVWGDGRFVVEAAFSNGTIFWHTECGMSSELVIDGVFYCSGLAYGGPNGGIEGGGAGGLLITSNASARINVPDGGTVRMWVDPGTGAVTLNGLRLS